MSKMNFIIFISLLMLSHGIGAANKRAGKCSKCLNLELNFSRNPEMFLNKQRRISKKCTEEDNAKMRRFMH